MGPTRTRTRETGSGPADPGPVRHCQRGFRDTKGFWETQMGFERHEGGSGSEGVLEGPEGGLVGPEVVGLNPCY